MSTPAVAPARTVLRGASTAARATPHVNEMATWAVPPATSDPPPTARVDSRTSPPRITVRSVEDAPLSTAPAAPAARPSGIDVAAVIVAGDAVVGREEWRRVVGTRQR